METLVDPPNVGTHNYMPASAQITESLINTNTMNGRMRVEGRVTCPSKSTPTERRYTEVMGDDDDETPYRLYA